MDSVGPGPVSTPECLPLVLTFTELASLECHDGYPNVLNRVPKGTTRYFGRSLGFFFGILITVSAGVLAKQ